VFDMSVVNQAYVYISARTSDNAYVLGDANDYYEYKVALPTSIIGGNNNPHVTFTKITSPTSPTSGLVVNSGTVFSSKAKVVGYYVCSFVTNAPVGNDFIDPEYLTESNVETFFSQHVSNGHGITISDQNPVINGIYYDTTDMPSQYQVGHITTDITIHKAFNSLDMPGGEHPMVNITDETDWTFTTVIVAVDTATRYGLGISEPYYIKKEALIDYFHIDLPTTYGTFSVVFETNPTALRNTTSFEPFVFNSPSATYIANSHVSTGHVPLTINATRLLTWDHGNWSTNANHSLSSPVPPLNKWSRYGISKTFAYFPNGASNININVSTLQIPSLTKFTIGNRAYKHTQSQGNWIGEIRNVAIFNTSIDFTTLPTDLSTITTSTYPSLVAFFSGSGGDLTSTVGGTTITGTVGTSTL
jgi:hypothetical protein